MKVIDIIKLLQAEGHTIKYTHRKDGGYVISRIDGVHYSRRTGVAMARQMTGVQLSVARSYQLQRIRLPKGRKYEKREPIPKEILNSMRRIQRKWRKDHPTISGTIGVRNVRYQLNKYGYEKTLEALDSANRHAIGLAYIENVNWLVERIRQDANKLNNQDLEKLANTIKSKALTFKEEWISKCYNVLYDMEKNENVQGHISVDEAVRQIKIIIGA